MTTTRQIPSSASYGLLELTNASGLRIQLLPDGKLFAIRHGDTLINQVIPTPAEHGMHRLVLRERGSEGSTIVDLVKDATAFAKINDEQVRWSGATSEFEHSVTLALHPERSLWLWHVHVRNASAQTRTFDLLHGQDLGLADEVAVRSNEAYISQYIDHCPVSHPRWGTVILSRQNMAQSDDAHPWLAHGCLTGIAAWATDGFQFFGLEHRLSGEPAAYHMERLPSQRLQYEFAYSALQTQAVTLSPGGTWQTAFFALYMSDHSSASSQADLAHIERSLQQLPTPQRNDFRPAGACTFPQHSVFDSAPLAGDELPEAEWTQLFPGERRHIERDDLGNLLSFFCNNPQSSILHPRHVVSRRKEKQAERPHGHLLRSSDELWLIDDALGSTLYASGVFNAQVFIGNANLARCLSVVRNPLDVMASSGQRVFIRHSHEQPWRRLGIPSAFDIGLNEVRWLYRIGGSSVEATTRVDPFSPRIGLSLRVLGDDACEFLVTHLLVMGDREMDQPFTMSVDPEQARIECGPGEQTLLAEKWPDLRFAISAAPPAAVAACGSDELLFADGKSRNAPYAVLQSRPVKEFSVIIEGRSLACVIPAEAGIQDSEAGTGSPPARGRRTSTTLLHGLPELRHPAAAHVAEALPWFAHNACTHFTAPRGLEQYGGAAWGVRDVCQGPVEWLLATRQFPPVRRILVQVFSQPYSESGCWPQWFMFEPFRLQSVHAHGDVPFWPVKALCDYVEATNDFALLDEEIPYTDAETFAVSERHDSVLQHALRVVDVFEARCITGTALVNYGDGDWDDTLQPADPSLRSNMVSAWTAALAYHAFRLLHRVCVRAGRTHEADRLAALLPLMQADFRQLLMPEGVLAGFLVFGDGAPRPLLHPQDQVTGIRYRLLPMTRAVLAELLTSEQAERHFGLIREHLLFPDGVRLMSDPVPYRGGVEHWFKRAETAANFGREIGLMYTHAHLRYVEALIKLGRGDEAWDMLGRVTPMQLHERVPNAGRRQANAFFSSSDGAFADRYEAAEHFDDLRTGKVSVKGGWRIYSSGPGLYVHRVVQGMLGLRDSFGDLVFDPVLPRALDGLAAAIDRDGHRLEIHYSVGARGHGVRRLAMNGHELPLDRREHNPYREGGVRIAVDVFNAMLGKGVNVVEVARECG